MGRGVRWSRLGLESTGLAMEMVRGYVRHSIGKTWVLTELE